MIGFDILSKENMVQKNKKNWEKFEDSSHTIVQSLNPQSQVYKNVHIEGKLSKVKRQVDIQLVKPEEYEFIAFECKDYNKPLDVPIIEAFNTKLQDIGAKKGAIVSNSPYSQASQNMAASLGIDLLNLVDTSNPQIKAKLYAGLLLSDISVKSFGLSIQSKSTNIQLPMPLDVRQVIFLDEQGRKGTAYQIFAWLWNDELSSSVKIPGFYEYKPPHSEEKKILGMNGEIIIPSEIIFRYQVVEKYYAGQIEMIETQGLYNVKEHSFQTKSLKTAPIVAYDIETSWPEITSEEAKKAEKEGKFSMVLSCSSVIPDNASDWSLHS